MNKVLIFCDDFYPNNTGYSNAFLGLIDSILNENENLFVEVITTFQLGNNEELKRKNLEIKRIRKISIPILGYILTSIYTSIYVNKYFFKKSFNLLFVETFDNVFFLSFLSKKICNYTLVRVHSTSDTEYTFFSKNIKYKIRKFFIKNYISKKIKFYASTNNFHIDFIKKKYFDSNLIEIGDKYFFLIPNTVKTENLEVKLCDVDLNKIKLLILGRMDTLGFNQKGFMDFIIALNLLNEKELTKYEINIVGSGTKLDYIKKITKRFNNLLFHENLSHNDCINLIKQVDIVLLPSRYEGLSMFALESLALGKICLFSNAGGLIDLMKSNGYLFEPQSYTELSDTLKSVLKLNQKELMSMKQNSLAIYNDNFSQKEVNRKFKFAYNIINIIE